MQDATTEKNKYQLRNVYIYHYFHSLQNKKWLPATRAVQLVLVLACALYQFGPTGQRLESFFFQSRHISSPTTNKQRFNNSESVRDFVICSWQCVVKNTITLISLICLQFSVHRWHFLSWYPAPAGCHGGLVQTKAFPSPSTPKYIRLTFPSVSSQHTKICQTY